MAMEDAYILSNLIAGVKGHEGVQDAFRAFDAVRRPRTQRLIELSRLSGLAIDFLLPGVDDDVGALRGRLEEWYKWLCKFRCLRKPCWSSTCPDICRNSANLNPALGHEDLESQLETAQALV